MIKLSTIVAGLLATAVSFSAFAVPDYCNDPVISPSPIPPECTDPAITQIVERYEVQDVLVCLYTDGGWLRMENLNTNIPTNNLTKEERCDIVRCVFNTASWCD